MASFICLFHGPGSGVRVGACFEALAIEEKPTPGWSFSKDLVLNTNPGWVLLFS